MIKIQSAGDHDPNADAEQEEHSIGGKLTSRTATIAAAASRPVLPFTPKPLVVTGSSPLMYYSSAANFRPQSPKCHLGKNM